MARITSKPFADWGIALKDNKKLIRKCILYYSLCAFTTGAAWQLYDYWFSAQFIERLFEGSTAYRIVMFIYAVTLPLEFVVGALLFYILIRKALNAESEKRVKEQSIIYAAIMHDLKTPITSIEGFAKALRDGMIPPEEQSKALDVICSKTRRMDELINSLYEYASLGAEEYRLKSEHIDASWVVREVVAEYYTDFEEHGIELNVNISDESLMIIGDTREFRRAVTNLVVNAWKHNEPGTKVLIAAKAAGDKLLVTVADNGAQIPQEMREVILQPFVTGDAARMSRNGSGLGLAIAAKNAALMGGALRIVDVDGEYVKAFEICGISLVSR